MWADFKAFLLQGSVVDLVTAFILGVAFSAVVTSFTDDVVMQLIAATVGQPDFSDVVVTLRGTPIRVGAFLTAATTFVIIATALFLFVRAVSRFREETPEPEEVQVELLREIRDELRVRR